MSRQGFGDRLAGAIADRGPVCVGIDPHPALLADWGLTDDAAGLRTFALTVIEGLSGVVAALKPQSAFFERHGSAGIAVLEEVVARCAQSEVLCIMDAKRGDIGSTMDAYTDAYLRDSSPLAADAVTLSPYLGFGTLDGAIDAAQHTGRGVFVLALTSNKQGEQVQHVRDDRGVAIAAQISAAAAARNKAQIADGAKLGSVGLVVGATVGTAPAELGLNLDNLGGPILAPGIGTQGGTAADLDLAFGGSRPHVLASASRSILRAGNSAQALHDAALALRTELT